jgi:SAM-dependent methyltransferase
MENVIKTYQDKGVVESFDKKREEFEYQKEKHKVESNFLLKSINYLNKNREYWEDIKVLDVGCGTGRMFQAIIYGNLEPFPEYLYIDGRGKKLCYNYKKVDVDYTGLDTSKEMTSKIHKIAKIAGEKKYKVKIGNATKIPFKDETFDITFSYHLLWHLPKKYQEKIIKEMFRVTKKDGFIIFDILNEKFIWDKIKGYFGIKKTKGVYKNDIFLEDVFDVEKFNDAILPDNKYKFFKIINKCRKVLPRNFFHMIYFKIQK